MCQFRINLSSIDILLLELMILLVFWSLSTIMFSLFYVFFLLHEQSPNAYAYFCIIFQSIKTIKMNK